MSAPTSVEDVAVETVLRETHRSQGPIVAPDPGIAARLTARGRDATGKPLGDLPDEHVAAVVLTSDELGIAGHEAEVLLHHAARALAPEGLLLITVRNRVFAEVSGTPMAGRGFGANELERLLGHFGFTPQFICAPGAASRVRASAFPDRDIDVTIFDVDVDRDPGLLHAGPTLFAAAVRAPDEAARSKRFFATLPRKVVAASTLCRADDGRILVVHDAFKQYWTIPGGVVDADENPRVGAEREAWEETGIRIAAGAVLGVFAGTWPDRVVFVYDGLPIGGSAPTPRPVHPHEIDAAEWVPAREALDRLAPHIAFQVRRCLSEPGGTWEQPRA